MRGFLRGERLDDTVPITEDGSVRKLHGNENAPLFASWIQRGWAWNFFWGDSPGDDVAERLGISMFVFGRG